MGHHLRVGWRLAEAPPVQMSLSLFVKNLVLLAGDRVLWSMVECNLVTGRARKQAVNGTALVPCRQWSGAFLREA